MSERWRGGEIKGGVGEKEELERPKEAVGVGGKGLRREDGKGRSTGRVVKEVEGNINLICN